jgi:hypothetical protein
LETPKAAMRLPIRAFALLIAAGAVSGALACRDSAGTSLFVVVTYDASIQPTQLQFGGSNSGGASLFLPLRRPDPESPTPLASGNSILLLINDSLAGEALTVNVDGLVHGATVASGSAGTVTVERGLTVNVTVALSPWSPDGGACSECDPRAADRCASDAGKCMCGAGDSCSGNNICDGGTCMCGVGPACAPGEECGGAACACGTHGPCPAGDACDGGVCTPCGPGSCAGCCSGSICVAVGNETHGECGMGGVACAGCTAGSNCQNGLCAAVPCGPGNCAGCCAENTCLPGNNDPAACGIHGTACLKCTAGEHGTSCNNGVCMCGQSAECVPPKKCIDVDEIGLVCA